jgi:tight adherence protein B
MSLPLIIGIVVVAVVLIIAVVSIRRQNKDIVEERLGRYTEYNFLPVVEEDKKGKDKEKKPSAMTQRLDRALTARKMGQTWKTELARADLKLTVAEYFAVHVIAAIGLGVLGYFVLFPGQIVMAIIAGVVGIFVPRFYVSYLKGKRLRMFEQQLPDILGLWVNSLRSGYSTMQSMEAISREAPNPSAQEFRRVVQEVQLGIPQESSLSHLYERMPSDDLDLIITAVNIQREVGGNLAEILEVISHTIRERIKLKGEVRVLTSQGRITGYLIGGLPIVLALFLALINPGYMGNLFTDRLCGWPMLAIGLGMIGIGTAVIQRIVDIEI